MQEWTEGSSSSSDWSQSSDNPSDTEALILSNQTPSDSADAAVETPNAVLNTEQGPSASQQSDVVPLSKFPWACWVIMAAEVGERFCFYGIRSVLPLYFTVALGLTEDVSTGFFHFWIFAAYFTPIGGAWLADGRWGRYQTVAVSCFVYMFGVVLALTASAMPTPPLGLAVFLGLAAVAVATGGVKANIAVMVADQVKGLNFKAMVPAAVANPRSRRRLARRYRKAALGTAFAFFYMSINVGSLGGEIVVPLLREGISFTAAFAGVSVAMCIAGLVFVSGRAGYVMRDAHKSSRSGHEQMRRRRLDPGKDLTFGKWMEVVQFAWRESARLKQEQIVVAPNGQLWEHWVDTAAAKYDLETVKAAKRVWRAFRIFLLLPAFWMLFDQHGSRWVFQATRMDPHIIPGLPFTLLPDQTPVIDPLLLLILIPIADRYVFPALRARGYSLHPLHRMGAGMVITGSAFFIAALIESKIEAGQTIAVGVISFQYLALVVGEILVSITGSEFAYSEAPASMKSSVNAAWLLTVAAGNVIVAIVAEMSLFESQVSEYILFGSAMMVCALGFAGLSYMWFKEEKHQIA